MSAGLRATRPVSRWFGAVLAALPVLVAVLMLSGGDVLTAHDHAQMAARLPGNGVMPALTLLPVADSRITPERQREIALAALRHAPLTGEALTWLAMDAAHRGDMARHARLLALSGKTGWHDERTQRILYDHALKNGDAPATMRHAEALLRQGKGNDELFPRFVQGMAAPRFRAALLNALSRGPAWGRGFLMRYGHELDDRALLDVAGTQHDLDRDAAAALLTRLLRKGRVNAAAALWAMVPPGGQSGAGILDWPDELARRSPVPFDWSLPQGFTVEGEGNSELVAARALPGEAARRTLVLTPGAYRIAASPAADWLWAAGCAPDAVVPSRSLTPDARFTVAAGCHATVIAVAPAPGGQFARLGKIAIEPMP